MAVTLLRDTSDCRRGYLIETHVLGQTHAFKRFTIHLSEPFNKLTYLHTTLILEANADLADGACW